MLLLNGRKLYPYADGSIINTKDIKEDEIQTFGFLPSLSTSCFSLNFPIQFSPTLVWVSFLLPGPNSIPLCFPSWEIISQTTAPMGNF